MPIIKSIIFQNDIISKTIKKFYTLRIKADQLIIMINIVEAEQ